MIQLMIELLSSVWHELEIDQPIPERTCTVLQSRNRIVVFVFDQLDSSHPLVVLKFARSNEQEDQLRRSVTSAQTVRALVDPELQITIPAMALLPNGQGSTVVVEKALHGDPFGITGIGRRFIRGLELQCLAFADWLIRFHGCTETGTLTIDKTLINAGTLKSYGNLGDDSHRRTVERELLAVCGTTLPTGWVYGDAHPSNILMQRNRVSGVVDWEGAQHEQLPVFDLFQFQLSLLQELLKRQYRDRMCRGIRSCQLILEKPSCDLGAIILRQTRYYFEHMNLPFNHRRALFWLFLTQYYCDQNKTVLLDRLLSLG